LNLTLLVSALVVGLLGGGHCVAMCGGLVSAVVARDRAASGARLSSIVVTQVAYHVGRVGTYALLGAAVGFVGSGARLVADIGVVQRAAYVAADVFLLVLAASLVVRVRPMVALQRVGAAATAPLVRHVQPLLRAPGLRGRVALGLAWGLMPCALVYSALPLALLAGGAAQGALVMLAFGLGTLPNLLAGGVLLAHARRALSASTLRYAGAAVLGAFGVLGLWRALAGPLGDLSFCLVP
jgi:uncharacterized protein